MTTISGTSGNHAGWSRAQSAGAHASGGSRADRMFAKVDADGSGSVDKTELQGMLDHIAEKTGSSLGSADDLMTTMDTDGNGSLSKSELAAGMKSLMPAPSSTVDFAQQSNGMPPPPPPSDDDSDALQKLFAAADTDGDKTISSSEADALKQKMDAVIQGLNDASTGASSTSTTSSCGSSSSSSSSTGGDASGFNLSAFVDLVLKQYAQGTATSTANSTTNSLSVTA